MLLDRRDIDILRLAGMYRWLPYANAGKFGFDDLLHEINHLASPIVDLADISRDKRYIKLSAKGYELLQKNGYSYTFGTKRAYAGSSALRRRLEVADIMLTCLRAGIDVFQDDVESLRNQPVFYPAFSLRSDINLMNSASCSGFGHWGNKSYMIQYVSPESPGMYLNNELRHMHNLASVFDASLRTPSAMLFAGSSYSQIYKQICDTAPSTRHGVTGFHDFWDVYQKIDMPVHLLPCTESGAVQLAVMSQPEYNAKIARAALGDELTPYDAELPDADGSVSGSALVIAADMNIRRIARVCESARSLGRKEVLVAALEEQMNELLLGIFPAYGIVTPLIIGRDLLDAAFPDGFTLHSMDKSPAYGADGELIYA